MVSHLRREVARGFGSFRNAFAGKALVACKSHQRPFENDTGILADVIFWMAP